MSFRISRAGKGNPPRVVLEPVVDNARADGEDINVVRVSVRDDNGNAIGNQWVLLTLDGSAQFKRTSSAEARPEMTGARRPVSASSACRSAVKPT